MNSPFDGADLRAPRQRSTHASFTAALFGALHEPSGRSPEPARKPAPISPEHMVELILGELSHVLWQQRDLINQLLFRLDVQRFVLTQARDRWIDFATQDVADALEDVRRQETFRTELLGDLAAASSIPTQVTLKELVANLDAPWDGIFAEHHAAFLALTAEVEQLTRTNSELLQRGLSDLGDLLSSFGDHPIADHGASGYESAGRQRPGNPHTGSASPRSHALLVDQDA